MTEEMTRYFQELNPKKRRKILKNMAESEDAGKVAALQALYGKRYETAGNGDVIDHYMFLLMDLQELGKHVPFLKSIGRKRLRKDLDQLGFGADQDEETQELLLKEIQNAAARYLNTCLDDSYGKLFGAIKPSDSRRRGRIQGDVQGMTELLKKAFYEDGDDALKRDLDLYCSAVFTAFEDFCQENYGTDEEDDDDEE